MKNKIKKIIDQRVTGIYNDLKAFVYIRKHNLQHQEDGIGGGNITQAIALFTILNFLGKIQYFIDKKSGIDLEENGDPKIIEEYAFYYLIDALRKAGIDLGLSIHDNETLGIVWKGFRNKLAHVSTVEDGKQVLVFTNSSSVSQYAIQQILENIKNKIPFEHDGSNRNWRINVDILLAKLPEIKMAVVQNLNNENNLDLNLLRKVVG